MDAENWIIEKSQRAENPSPRQSMLFVRCKGRISENEAANPAQKRVGTVRMPCNCSGNKHLRCNEPRDVEADQTSDTAPFHVISSHAYFTSDIRESEQKFASIGDGLLYHFCHCRVEREQGPLLNRLVRPRRVHFADSDRESVLECR